MNLDLIFERLGFPLPPSEDLKFVSDIKLLLLCLGIHGSTSTHSCPFCEGHRARWGKDKDGVERWIKQGGAGRWIPGEPRTLRSTTSGGCRRHAAMLRNSSMAV